MSRSKRARVETPVEEEYDSREYWEKRYQSSAGYHNWYYSFDELQPFFSRILGENFLLEGASVGSVLEIGCGDSPLIHHFSPPKCAQTTPHLFGIDFSPTIVRHLQATLQKGPSLCFSEMDAGRTTFVSGKFALVIDKGARVRRKSRRHK